MMRALAKGLCGLAFLAWYPLHAADLAELALRLDLAEIGRGQFVQERELRILPQPLRSQGTFVFVRGVGLYWQVQQPLLSELRVRDGRVQERLDGTVGAWSEPLLGTQGSAIAARVLTGLLAADLVVLSEYFEPELSMSEEGWLLQLQPRAEALSAFLGRIQVRGDTQIRQLDIYGRDDELTRIVLAHEPGAPLSATERRVLFE